MRNSSYPHPTNSMPVEYQISSRTARCESTEEILRDAERIRRLREELARELAELDSKQAA